MKNVIKLSFLGLALVLTVPACDLHGHAATSPIDSVKIKDSLAKADSAAKAAPVDSTKKDSTKKM